MKYGSFFERITGIPIDSCTSLTDVDKTLEKHFGRPLRVIDGNQTLVPNTEVIPITHVDMTKIDTKIDKILKKIAKQ